MSPSTSSLEFYLDLKLITSNSYLVLLKPALDVKLENKTPRRSDLR